MKERLVSGGMQKGVSSITGSQTDEMLFVELALRVKMQQDFDKLFWHLQLNYFNFNINLDHC